MVRLLNARSNSTPLQRQERLNGGLSRRHGQQQPPPRTGLLAACCSRQSMVTLGVGVLIGYVLLPVALVELDLQSIMSGLPDIEHSPYNIPRTDFPSTGGLRPVEGDSVPKPPRTLENVVKKAQQVGPLSSIEQRIVEDREILAQQSLPTATTPYIMKTKTLPDHHRLKILVTGGAGFVGSHLVDKLMMEGHEVIVVDNFFTGQKKNVAHWLHHPNFRSVTTLRYMVLCLSRYDDC